MEPRETMERTGGEIVHALAHHQHGIPELITQNNDALTRMTGLSREDEVARLVAAGAGAQVAHEAEMEEEKEEQAHRMATTENLHHRADQVQRQLPGVSKAIWMAVTVDIVIQAMVVPTGPKADASSGNRAL
jgi:hypothetical protein